jgi:hypothetical protein
MGGVKRPGIRFRVVPHSVTPGVELVEVRIGARLVATIYVNAVGADAATISVVSKYLRASMADATGAPPMLTGWLRLAVDFTQKPPDESDG